MEKIFSVLFNTGHQFPGWEIVLVLIVLALVLPPLMEPLGAPPLRHGQEPKQEKGLTSPGTPAAKEGSHAG